MSNAWALSLTVFLIVANAFFVAGEFAVTSSRRAKIEPLVEEGKLGAKWALFAVEHISVMLAICQLGVTVASTSLGMVAEPAIAHWISAPLAAVGLPAASAHVVGFVGALGIVLLLHVVLGEMVPKNISVSAPETALLWLAAPLVWLAKVFGPIVGAMDRMANRYLRWMKVEPRTEVAATFTVEEVASIVQRSEQAGTLRDEVGLLSTTLEFSTSSVADAMVPLDQIVTLPALVSAEQVEQAVAHTGFSRYPVVNEVGSPIGYVHIKDAILVDGPGRQMPMASKLRPLPRVQAQWQIEQALQIMQREGTHLAQVASRGKIVGVLFLEDIIEELVGEVRDLLQRENYAD